ncbi:MAG: hypothetical protein HYX22_01290 [Candidatus Yanofskybacteria bacterium]|nr:hypothetical protein [Candidatus Yanofskybacteria bacterium]
MLRNITSLFHKKRKAIEDELSMKIKVDGVLAKFVKEEVLKNADLDYFPSYTINKGIIKIETDNKIIAQEIALRIRTIEDRLRKEGVEFRKVLV